MPALHIACPACGSRRTAVVMTRQLEDSSILRRRKCNGCGHRWYTRQQPEVVVSAYAIVWDSTGANCVVTEVQSDGEPGKTEAGSVQDGEYPRD